MPVVKEWECKAHGYFDAHEGVCPHGCPEAFVERVFLTAPTIGSAKTKVADKMVRNLANDFGMTDVRGAREGEAVAHTTPASSTPFRMDKPGWLPVGKSVDVRSFGVTPDNALAGVQSTLTGPRPGQILGRYDGPAK